MPSDTLDFTHRADLAQCPEWMDEPCSYEHWLACIGDLAQVNRLTFAARPTLAWLRRFAGRSLHIVDVGFGGGDTLRRVERWAQQTKTPVRLTGIDLNPYAARAAQSLTPPRGSRIEWITGDAFSVTLPQPPDLIVSSLFTHHLPHAELIQFLQWMEREARVGWFINDLERARTPYHLFRALAWAMRWHPFVRHDGPVSIRRAFTRDDWRQYLQEAGLADRPVELQSWKPARLCVAREKSHG